MLQIFIHFKNLFRFFDFIKDGNKRSKDETDKNIAVR